MGVPIMTSGISHHPAHFTKLLNDNKASLTNGNWRRPAMSLKMVAKSGSRKIEISATTAPAMMSTIVG